MRLNLVSLIALAFVVAACGDDVVQPRTTTNIPLPAAAVQVDPASRYVVEFNGPVRKDFADRVAALGGSVSFVSESGGFAGVSGLTADAAAKLSAQTGVGSVYQDIVVQMKDATSYG